MTYLAISCTCFLRYHQSAAVAASAVAFGCSPSRGAYSMVWYIRFPFNCMVVSDFQFVESRRKGNPLIMHRGYTYWLFRESVDIGLSRWRCSSHKSKKCRGKLLFNRNGPFVTPTCDHNHPPPKYIIQNGKYVRVGLSFEHII